MKRYQYDIKSRTYVERKQGAVCAYSDVVFLAKECLPYLNSCRSALTEFVNQLLDSEDRIDYERLTKLIAELEEIAGK